MFLPKWVKEDAPVIKELTFKASKPDGAYGLHKIHEVTFKLGLGPCGRHVEKLSCEVSGSIVKVTQESYLNERPFQAFSAQVLEDQAWEFEPKWFGLRGDKVAFENLLAKAKLIRGRMKTWQDSVEIKEFIYKMSDIHGRIVIVK